MKRLIFALLALSLLAACAPTQMPTQTPPDTVVTSPPVDSNPPPADTTSPAGGLPPIYAPRPGDENLARAEVIVDSTDLTSMESFPVQFAILLKGNLPTPCHELRVAVNPPDTDNQIKLEVYAVADPNAVCVQMVQPFEQNVYLGSFPAGQYSVWVNGKQVAELVSG